LKPLSEKGHVTFVGAGPGDPDLLTVKALRTFGRADTVLFDALVSQEILELVPKGVPKLSVGKRAGGQCTDQKAINRLMIREASGGHHVVRLKGGDPMIFGRLTEEMAALRAAGIAFSIVPGITTASAAAAFAQISLTERGIARRIQFVTGHLRKGDMDAIDWRLLADPDCTTVIYMGRSAVDSIDAGARAYGLSADLPVMLLANVGRHHEQIVVTTIGKLNQAVGQIRSEVPLVFIVGYVVQRAALARPAEVMDGLR